MNRALTCLLLLLSSWFPAVSSCTLPSSAVLGGVAPSAGGTLQHTSPGGSAPLGPAGPGYNDTAGGPSARPEGQ